MSKNTIKSSKVDVDNAITNKTTIEEEANKRVLIDGLSVLFKRNVLIGPVYTLEVLRTLHLQHLGFDPTK